MRGDLFGYIFSHIAAKRFTTKGTDQVCTLKSSTHVCAWVCANTMTSWERLTSFGEDQNYRPDNEEEIPLLSKLMTPSNKNHLENFLNNSAVHCRLAQGSTSNMWHWNSKMSSIYLASTCALHTMRFQPLCSHKHCSDSPLWRRVDEDMRYCISSSKARLCPLALQTSTNALPNLTTIHDVQLARNISLLNIRHSHGHKKLSVFGHAWWHLILAYQPLPPKPHPSSTKSFGRSWIHVQDHIMIKWCL